MGMGVQCLGEDDVISFLFRGVNQKLQNNNFDPALVREGKHQGN